MDNERSLTIPPPDIAMLERVREFAANAKSLVVSDLASRDGAALQLREVATFAKFVDDDRKKRTRPLDAEKKEIMDEYRPVEAELAVARQSLTLGITEFDKEERRKALAAQRAADEAAEKERQRLERLREKAEARGDERKAQEFDQRASFVATAAPVAAPLAKLSGIGETTTWKFEVVDASKLPARYLVPDEKAIGAAVRQLKGDAANLIPGIRVWSETGVSVRTL